MKKPVILTIIAYLLFSNFMIAQNGQEPEQLGLPGDNLNLYAVLKLFTESKTLEGFERSLNDEQTNINNLDLDGDNKTDYIRVSDHADGEVHNISLKVAVSKEEDQDVAVIMVRKIKDGQAQVQVIGDEELYGPDYIIEPNYEEGGTPNPGYMGNNSDDSRDNYSNEDSRPVTTYQVANWPVVEYMFMPGYTTWNSPWYWGYYPTYWNPWQPMYWHAYYGYHYYWNYYYYSNFRYWPHYRYPNWRTQYYNSPYRSTSVIVQTRYNRGDYRQTYSRPETVAQGSDRFKTRYPSAPTVNSRPPAFDRSATARPVVNRPAPGRQPANNTGRPAPGQGNEAQRPTVRPFPTNPGETPGQRPQRPITPPTTDRTVNRPQPVRPETRPVPAQPSTRPAPAQRPVSRPVPSNPAPRQAPSQPVMRPTPAPRPAPASRPASRKPPEARPLPSRPVDN